MKAEGEIEEKIERRDCLNDYLLRQSSRSFIAHINTCIRY